MSKQISFSSLQGIACHQEMVIRHLKGDPVISQANALKEAVIVLDSLDRMVEDHPKFESFRNTRAANPEVETHLGLGEYYGQEHLYDGHVTACESGAVEDVISYLNELKDFIPAGEVSLTWQGSNGLWFAGSEALDAIDAELDRITGKTEGGGS